MKRFEYKEIIVTIKTNSLETIDFQIGEEQYAIQQFVKSINKLGYDGWELTAIITQKFGFTAIFKTEWEVTPNTGPK